MRARSVAQTVRYLAAAVPARRGLGDDLQSCAVLLLVAMRLELKTHESP